MDILSKWNQILREDPFSPDRKQNGSMPGMVHTLLEQHCQIWWDSEQTFPGFKNTYTQPDQTAGEKQLDGMVNGLIYELKHVPAEHNERNAQQERLREQGRKFVCEALNLEHRHLAFIEKSGMLEASEEFARKAREFDRKLSAEDIYQASRNVMTMNFMQLLLGLPVEVTPSVFAYSMLYPYTDNYLDDPDVSQTAKLVFNHRFQSRLEGEEIRPYNRHEAVIFELVSMVESQWERTRYPLLYESLLAIHKAQVHSLRLVKPGASPYELNVLGISFEKGGTSVLADGYLVAGWLAPAQAELMFGYGAFTQLMDDLEDVLPDMKDGRMTIFSQTAHHWPLDQITNRMFHFGRAIFNDLSAFNSPAAAQLKEIIEKCVDPLLINSISQLGRFYSSAYLRQLERHFPFRFTLLRKQRRKLNRHKITLEQLIETFLFQPAR